VRSVGADLVAAAVAAVFPPWERASLTSFWFPRVAADLRARGVLYLPEADLSDDQFAAVSRRAEALGDGEFYLSYAERVAGEDKV
jgi:hypothetical protein